MRVRTPIRPDRAASRPGDTRSVAGLTLTRARDDLQALASCLLTVGRLQQLELLLLATIEEKLAVAEQGFWHVDQALGVESLLLKSFNQKRGPVKWDPKILAQIRRIIATDDLLQLRSLIAGLQLTYRSLANDLSAAARDDYLLQPLVGQLQPLIGHGPPAPKRPARPLLNTHGGSRVARVLQGPPKIKLDPVFDTSYAQLDYTLPENANTIEEIVPSCWSVAQGEMRACELCALSVIEYDHLPLQFYWDFAKQTWDEARHAIIYLDLSLSHFDGLLRTLDPAQPLHAILRRHRESGAGLPLPQDRNTWEAILNSELEERIILLNILTETPAVGRLTEKIKKPICAEYPSIRRVLEYDRVDEIFHSRIGAFWLKFLIPDRRVRWQRVEDAKLLKGFLLLTSMREYTHSEIEDLAAEYAT